MSVDPWTLLAILVMASITYATRISGVLLGGRLKLSPRAQAAFNAVPPAVLVALIAPSALATGGAETIAALAAALAATRLPLLGVIAVGVVTVVALRAFGL
ncbi:putative membrane protein [Methylopila capsulata]|uniref:Membrane protein n=1 Tax=Methylopila capsulata TaxID=61654 RepID=A0A9W6MS46_9HYPH|nr:AzlD domain-containing protein [Methylopila capsulata]MBM7850563.1 putative membrane protein [Methylopila capsulata]GLK55859.1 membrane protein [Methylopila capsulata]